MVSFSYRTRLLIYSLGMMLFLAGTLLYSYQYVKKLIYTEAEEHISRVAQLSHMRLEDTRHSLQRYTEIVRDDLRLQEYLFVVSKIGSDSKPLQELYKRHFGWLPIDRYLIVDSNNKIIIGHKHHDLYTKLLPLLQTDQSGTFYVEYKNGLEVVAMSAINYRDSSLGTFIVSRDLTQAWLNQHHQDTGIIAFFEQHGIIISSSLAELNGAQIDTEKAQLSFKNDTYHIERLSLKNMPADLPKLWFALSNTELTKRLHQHQQTILTNAGIGIIAILVLGLLLIRNFSKPLTQLMQLTKQIANGHLPLVSKSQAKNEIAALANHFADMVIALKDKQAEIERVHATLEKSAITDILTGLYNRRYLQVVFPKLVAQAQRDNNQIAAILIDLDHFKKINDTHGHVTGDMCLAGFSDELKKFSRANDYLFRIGGEEFLVLSISEDLQGICQFAEKLRQGVEQNPVRYAGKIIPMTISCGITIATPTDSNQENITRILSMADKAMYEAKQNGRNRVCLASGLSDPQRHQQV